MIVSVTNMIDTDADYLDVQMECPFCNRRSHVEIKGTENVKITSEYLSSNTMLVQELPFSAPIREFLKSGYCHDCMEIFGETSDEIRYVKTINKKERR